MAFGDPTAPITAAMATTTEPTQRIAGPARTSLTDSHITPGLPARPSSAILNSSVTLPGERPAIRPRPVSVDSPHETSIPNRQRASSTDPARKATPAEFGTAMAHFYRG